MNELIIFDIRDDVLKTFYKSLHFSIKHEYYGYRGCRQYLNNIKGKVQEKKIICPSCEEEATKLYPYAYGEEIRRVCKGCIDYFKLHILEESLIELVEKVRE